MLSYIWQWLASTAAPTIKSAATGTALPETVLAQVKGHFLAHLDTTLKDGRYKIVRKIGQGTTSIIFLVEDTAPSPESSQAKYKAAKILTVGASRALQAGVMLETEILEELMKRPESPSHEKVRQYGTYPCTSLPLLWDSFAQHGVFGAHICLIMDAHCDNLHRLRASFPNGRLPFHVVKPIVGSVATGLADLHSKGIVHSDLKADNVLVNSGLPASYIEETMENEPQTVDGEVEVKGKTFPVLRSQPFPPRIPWDISPFQAELIGAVVTDFGSAFWANKKHRDGDLYPFALRAPENIVRAECGPKIDVWALGCMVYELFAGQILFRPNKSGTSSADRELLLMQYALTGETLDSMLIEHSRRKTDFFDEFGMLLGADKNPYRGLTIEGLLRSNSDLPEVDVIAASRFIRDCLRLNPTDRLTAEDADVHPWLQTAFMGFASEGDVPTGPTGF